MRFACLFLALSFVTSAAQTVVPATQYGMTTNINRTPSPGDGHDYLHDLDETVNPANGALSVRIEVHPPLERGANFPMYAFMYDSDQEHTVVMQQNNGPCIPDGATGNYNFQYGMPICVNSVNQPALYDTSNLNSSQGGTPTSVNTGPNTLAYQRQVTFTYPITNVEDTACQVNTGYVYEDYYGRKHNLGILNVMPVMNNGLEIDGLASCRTFYGIQPSFTGGDTQYKALTAGQLPSVVYPGSSDPFAATVADANGNWASFGDDANGNAGRGTGRSGYTADGHIYMPGASVFPPPVGTQQINFPGYATPYTYTVANQAMTYQIGYTDITPLGETLCGGQSNTNSNNTRSAGNNNIIAGEQFPKYTGIKLPNGLSYTFSYDSAYGLISKITYPTGAWVKYAWGTNVDSEMMSWGPAFGALLGAVEPVQGSGINWSMNGAGTAAPNSTYCSFHHDFPAIIQRVVSYDGVNPAQEQDFAYTTNWLPGYPNNTQWTSKTTTVTTTDLLRPGTPSFRTVYTYGLGLTFPTPLGHVTTSGVPQEDTIAYYDTTGSLLKTVQKVWGGYAESPLMAECVYLPNGNVTGTFYQYQSYPVDSPNNFTGPYFGLTDIKNDIAEYDYGIINGGCVRPTSAPTRETVVNFASFGATPGLPVYTVNYGSTSDTYSDSLPSLWNRPSAVKTYDHGTLIAETDYGYDENPLVPVNAPLNHDETNYGAAATSPRGNTTTIKKKCFVSGVACPDSITHITYDTTGQVVAVKDPNGNTTTMSYADNYTTDDGSPTGNTNTYISQITRPTTNGVPHISYYQWDFNKGELRGVTDENSQPTTYQYADPWNRLTQSNYADGGQTTIAYSDGGPTPSISTKEVLSSSGAARTTTTVMDGFGHTIETRLTSDPSGTDYVDTVYDGMGLPFTITNPFRSQQDAVTTYTYDSLGRTTFIQYPDQSSTTKSYFSNSVLTTDEANASTTNTFDALGRLTSVREGGYSLSCGLVCRGSSPRPLSGGLVTNYTYDALNNLTGVAQNGNPGFTPQGFTSPETSKLRSFGYNSLSQLLWSQNPETGTICYGTIISTGAPLTSGNCQANGYDFNGNLLYKTDATGMMITYGYDPLNRMRTKSAPDGMTGYTLDYDLWTNGIGHLSRELSPYGVGTAFNYDVMGRVASTIPYYYVSGWGWSTGMQVQYDLAGEVTQITYPDQRVVTQGWDAAGHLTSITDTTPNGVNTTYLSNAQYWPSGALQTATLGTSVMENFQLNTRLQPCRSLASTTLLPSNVNGGNLFDRQSYYSSAAASPCGSEPGNNGNVYAIVDNLAQTAQGFGYDSLNRLTSASSVSGANMYNQLYHYDSFGNMVLQDLQNYIPSYSIDQSTNRLLANGSDLQYAANGVLTSSPGMNYITTAEGYLRCINGCANGSYLYDSLGERTLAVHNSNTSGLVWNEYAYLNRQPMADVDNNGMWTDYIYANGAKIAKVSSAEALVHTQGNVSQTWVECSSYLGNTGLAYPVQAGDTLAWREYKQNAVGGINLYFDFGGIQWAYTDTNGVLINQDSHMDQWVYRQFNLGQFAGHTFNTVELLHDVASAPGAWDIWYGDMVVVSVNGAVKPLFTGSPVSVQANGCQGPATSYVGEIQNPSTAPAEPASSGTRYYLDDHLGTTQMELSSGGWPTWTGAFTPFGQEIVAGGTTNYLGQQPGDGTSMRFKFTGKERDAESGLDYFGARYYGSNMGRMMSPDWSAKAEPVPYAKLDNPQSLNLYSYVLNNPLRYIDADGHYELNASNCNDNAKCQKKYDKAANKFEKQREKNLNSKNDSIRNAAASYGAKGEANGVHVGFGDTKSGGTNGGVDISGSGPGNTNIQVTLDFSRAGSSETITHEGTHVMEDQKFLNSFDPATGGFNQNFNFTHFQTEFDAFRAGAMVNHEHGFGPNDVQGITNYINTNYPARILPLMVFPVGQFPAGVPDDEH